MLDACVLAPYNLCNVLLTLAEENLFQPLWSATILEETRRTLVERLGVPSAKADNRIAAMTGRFPEALVENFESLIPSMTNDSKDRHVLAAAVRSGAQVIVTANLKDFPVNSTSPYDIDVVHPDQFLLSQYDLDPETTSRALTELASMLRRPSLSVVDVLVRLRIVAPNFAQILGSYFKGEVDLPVGGLPAGIAMAPLSDVRAAFASNNDAVDQTDARQVGYAWNVALRNYPEYANAFGVLSVDASDWDNPQALAAGLDNWGFLSNVMYAIEDPENVAYMRFVEGLTVAGQVFSAGSVPGQTMIMTLIRAESSGTWHVFSLSPDYIYAGDIFNNWVQP